MSPPKRGDKTRLNKLRMIIPTATRIAALFNSANPSNLSMLDKVHAYARSIGTMVQPAEVRAPGELEREFGAIIGLRPDALLVINDASILDLRERIGS